MMRVRERQLANFVPWGPAEFNMSIGKNPIHAGGHTRVNGLLLANHTSISSVFPNLNGFSVGVDV